IHGHAVLAFSDEFGEEGFKLGKILRDEVGRLRLGVAIGQLLHRVLVLHRLVRAAAWAASTRFSSRFSSTCRAICFSFAAAARRRAISASSRAHSFSASRRAEACSALPATAKTPVTRATWNAISVSIQP